MSGQKPVENFLPVMEALALSSASLNAAQYPSPYCEELSTQWTSLFSDSLKDLRNLRSQLYSAAEYFELSYANDVQKQIVVDSLKDYTVKALVNTVDHLGSVSHKVNGYLDEKVDEVSVSEIRVSCIEQRLCTCQEIIDLEGIKQQSLVTSTPKYHKRYILPVGKFIPECGRHDVTQHAEISIAKEDRELRVLQAGLSSGITSVYLTVKERPSSRKFRSPSPSRRGRSFSPSRKARSHSPSPQPGKVQPSETRAGSTNLTSSPNFLFPYGSLSRRSTTMNCCDNVQQYSTKHRKSTSDFLRVEGLDDDQKDAEQNPSRGKRLLKALLGRRKSRRDDMLYMYLDEY